MPNTGNGVIPMAFKIADKGTKAASLPNYHNQVNAQTKHVVSKALNAQNDNQYYQKLSEEKGDGTEKSKKRQNLAKYVPAMVGAAVLAAATHSAIKSKSVTKPFKDAYDGIKRAPAALVNKFSKTPVGKGVVDGVRKGVKKSKNAAKPKVNNSPMANFGLGLAKGTGQFIPFLAGSAYLDYKAKQAKTKSEEGDRKRLAGSYKKAHSVGTVTMEAAKGGKNIAAAIIKDRKGENEDGKR